MSASGNDLPERVLGEITRWVGDPFNESFMFQRPWQKLQEFSSSSQVKPSEILESLTALSTWYASKGIVEMLAGRSTEGLCDSFWCDLIYNTIMKRSFQGEQNQKKGSLLGSVLGRQQLKQPKPRISFNDQGLLLAKAFALGLVSEGEAIGRDSLIGLRDRRFYGLSQDKLTPFVLRVFAKWKDIALTPEEFPFQIPDAYQGLLHNLTREPDQIRTELAKACDFHLSRSKEPTDRETYEFADPVYAIYPVEVLMVFRIRQILGLSNPEVDHPLLNSPLGQLPESGCSMNPSLKPILEKLERR